MSTTLADEREKRHLRALERLRASLPLFAKECLRIEDKAGQTIPLVLNRTQLYVHERVEAQKARTGRVRVIIGKGRQTTVSTYFAARGYHRATLHRGVRCHILTHEQEATDTLFKMVERFQRYNPIRPSTANDNAKELEFDILDGGYSVGTARTKGAGRSKRLSMLHWCLAEGSLILRPDGRLTPIEQFTLGDVVRTHTNQGAPITAISQREKLCQSVVFRSLTSFPLILSGEHRIWTRDGWAKIDDVEVGDAIGFPVRSISRDVARLSFRLDPVRLGGKKPTGPTSVVMDYELGRVVGLYLAEGSIIAPSATNVPSGVTFSVHEDEVDRTVAWLEGVEGLYRSMKVAPSRTSKTVHVTVYSKSLGVFLRILVGQRDTKHLPDKWWMMGEDFVRGLVHGYLSGDGHFSPARSRIIEATSICSAVTTGIRDALASLGYGWASIKHKSAAVRHGRYEGEAYVLRLCGSGVERLSVECGKPFVVRQRRDLGNHGNVRIEGGYAWLPIVSKADAGLRRVYDFEVGHDDHSYCTLHGATHNSEVAHSPNAAAHFAGIVQSVPDLPDTEVVLESTGDGPAGEYFERWQQAEAGIGDYEAIFAPWYWTVEYARAVPDGFSLSEEEARYRELFGLTLGQMVWRRAKIAELKDPKLFKQEYPASATEMFEATGKASYIDPELVIAARKAEREGIGPLVVGVDPARFGDDRFSIAWRRGRKVLKVESRNKIGTMEALAWLKDIIDQDKPAKMFIDAGGGGDRLFDILQSYGEPYASTVVLVNFGGAPQTEVIIERDGTKRAGPANRRVEMWMRSKGWLEQVGGADLPDRDSLQMDAAAPRYDYRTTDQALQLESKEKIRARGVRSPDEWDAVALTFAEPVRDAPSRPAPARRAVQAGGSVEAGTAWMGT